MDPDFQNQHSDQSRILTQSEEEAMDPAFQNQQSDQSRILPQSEEEAMDPALQNQQSDQSRILPQSEEEVMDPEQQELQEGFKRLSEDITQMLTELQKCFSKLKEVRNQTLQKLENLIVKAKEQEDLQKHGRNTQIAFISGSSAAITGGILGAVGFGLSFVTFGTSLILTAVGAGIGGAGGMTVAGTSITKHVLNKEMYKEVQAAIDEDRKATEDFLSKYTGVQGRIKHVKKLGLVKAFIEKLMNHPSTNTCRFLKHLWKDIVFESICAADSMSGIAKGSANIGLRTVAVGVDAAVDSGATVFRSLSTARCVVHIGGFVVSVVLLPFDIHTLVTNSIKFHKDTNDVEEKIKKQIAKLRLPEDDKIPNIIEQCLRECLGDKLGEMIKTH